MRARRTPWRRFGSVGKLLKPEARPPAILGVTDISYSTLMRYRAQVNQFLAFLWKEGEVDIRVVLQEGAHDKDDAESAGEMKVDSADVNDGTQSDMLQLSHDRHQAGTQIDTEAEGGVDAGGLSVGLGPSSMLSSRLGQDSQLSEASDVEGALAATSELEYLDERVAGLRDNAGSEAAGGLSLQPSTVGDLSTAGAESDEDNDEDHDDDDRQ